MSTKPWERQPDEPAIWYARFHDHYLLSGTERTLDLAYRRFREKAQAGDDPARRSPVGRPPGSWSEMARKWRWAERAQAWDEDERARLRKAHFAKLKTMNERHQTAAQAAFARSIKALTTATTEGLSLPQAIACLERAIGIERRAMGEPLGVELVVRDAREDDGDFGDAIREASGTTPDRFEASPEIYAAVAREMEKYEAAPGAEEPPADPDVGPVEALPWPPEPIPPADPNPAGRLPGEPGG